MREGRQANEAPPPSTVRLGRIQIAGDPTARLQKLHRVQQRQGAAARDPDRPGRNLPRVFEQDLGGSDREHPWQCPAGKRNRPLLRAGG